MGDIRTPQSVLQILAAFSCQGERLDGPSPGARRKWGPIALVSPRFEFRETDYYAETMGGPLRQTVLCHAQLAAPKTLPSGRSGSNAAEMEIGPSNPRLPLARPINLDPGYLSQSKLVLASTKDHAHRLYVGHGIYAEITLRYYHGAWTPQPWTYPDYRRADYHQFFDECRSYLRWVGVRVRSVTWSEQGSPCQDLEGTSLCPNRPTVHGIMKAYHLTGPGGLDCLQQVDLAPPPLGPQQVRLQMRAWSLNYRDLSMPRGRILSQRQSPHGSAD